MVPTSSPRPRVFHAPTVCSLSPTQAPWLFHLSHGTLYKEDEKEHDTSTSTEGYVHLWMWKEGQPPNEEAPPQRSGHS